MTRTVVHEIAVGAIRVELERPADAESLIDEQRFDDDEFLPYWAEQWPSGLALAEHLSTQPVDGAHILELGCGLGLPSLVGAKRGAIVVATDWSSDALALLERNAARNDITVEMREADWRRPEVFAALGRFDLVLAADVLYEERNVAPIVDALRRLATATLVADPGRRHAEAFLDAVRMQGWAVTTVAHAQIPRGGIHRLEPIGLRPS